MQSHLNSSVTDSPVALKEFGPAWRLKPTKRDAFPVLAPLPNWTPPGESTCCYGNREDSFVCVATTLKPLRVLKLMGILRGGKQQLQAVDGEGKRENKRLTFGKSLTGSFSAQEGNDNGINMMFDFIFKNRTNPSLPPC